MSIPLKELCELIVDCPHSTAPDEGAGYPLIRTPNVGCGYLDLSDVHRVSKETYDVRNARAVPQPMDMILAREAPAGNVGIIREGQQVCLGQRTVLIRPNQQKANPWFLNYYLNAPQQRHRLLSNANGATVSHVNMPIIRNLPVELPSLHQQLRIASILRTYDNLIENNRRQISLLEEAAQRLYKEWFVDLNFPGCEDAEIVDGIPVSWQERKLSEIADVVMGQSPKSEYYNDEKRGMPFHQGVGSYGARFVKDDIYTTSVTRVGKAGSILFSVRAPVGRLNYTRNDIVLGRGLAAINHKAGLQSFLYYMLKERFFEEDIIGNGSIFASITKGELLAQKFRVPSIDLAEKFDSYCKLLDKKIERCDELIVAASEARNRLLPKLMSGDIEVS